MNSDRNEEIGLQADPPNLDIEQARPLASDLNDSSV
jgi:hypothetical protein